MKRKLLTYFFKKRGVEVHATSKEIKGAKRNGHADANAHGTFKKGSDLN